MKAWLSAAGETAASIVTWFACLAWGVPWMLFLTCVQYLVGTDRVGMLNPLYHFYTRIQTALTGSRWSSVVHPSIDPHRIYVFMQNHTNHFDFVTMYPATPHFKQGIELEAHFRYPVYGQFMRSRGTIPVRKGHKNQLADLREHVQKEVALGRSILVFPEGTRTLDGRVGRFRKGAFYIARDLGLPIVPVSVVGMFDVMRKGSLHIHPFHRVTVYCDEPIPTKDVSDDNMAALIERVQTTMKNRIESSTTDITRA